jgi:peroxiredoxin family protein
MSQETKKIAIILSSDDHVKVQLAGMIASVAAVSEIEVLVFVSMGAVRKFKKGISEDEKFSGDEFSQVMRKKKVPPYLDLFQQAKEFGGAKIYACPMALEVLEWTKDDMEDVFDDVAGLTKFLVDADGFEMLHL